MNSDNLQHFWCFLNKLELLLNPHSLPAFFKVPIKNPEATHASIEDLLEMIDYRVLPFLREYSDENPFQHAMTIANEIGEHQQYLFHIEDAKTIKELEGLVERPDGTVVNEHQVRTTRFIDARRSLQRRLRKFRYCVKLAEPEFFATQETRRMEAIREAIKASTQAPTNTRPSIYPIVLLETESGSSVVCCTRDGLRSNPFKINDTQHEALGVLLDAFKRDPCARVTTTELNKQVARQDARKALEELWKSIEEINSVIVRPGGRGMRGGYGLQFLGDAQPEQPFHPFAPI